MILKLVRKDLVRNTEKYIGVAANLKEADRFLLKSAKLDAREREGIVVSRAEGYHVIVSTKPYHAEPSYPAEPSTVAIYTFENPA